MTVFDDTQSQVWSTVQALNRAWAEGDPSDLTDFFHPDMIAVTPADRARLVGGAVCVAAWSAYVRHAKVHSWVTEDPLVRVYGDAAVVSYVYRITVEMAGVVHDLRGRDLLFLVREDGKWWLVGDAFSGEPG